MPGSRADIKYLNTIPVNEYVLMGHIKKYAKRKGKSQDYISKLSDSRMICNDSYVCTYPVYSGKDDHIPRKKGSKANRKNDIISHDF